MSARLLVWLAVFDSSDHRFPHLVLQRKQVRFGGVRDPQRTHHGQSERGGGRVKARVEVGQKRVSDIGGENKKEVTRGKDTEVRERERERHTLGDSFQCNDAP